jgi:hypothetical protein
MSIWVYVLLIACGLALLAWLVMDTMSLWLPDRYEKVRSRFSWLRVPKWPARKVTSTGHEARVQPDARDNTMKSNNLRREVIVGAASFAVGIVIGAGVLHYFGQSRSYSMMILNPVTALKIDNHTGQTWRMDIVMVSGCQWKRTMEIDRGGIIKLPDNEALLSTIYCGTLKAQKVKSTPND